MMNDKPYYQMILEKIPDEIGKKIMRLLAGLPDGEAMSRYDLIRNVFDVEPPRDLHKNKEDWQIRAAINKLQLKGFPVISVPGIAGYKLAEGDEKMAYESKLTSMRDSLTTKIMASKLNYFDKRKYQASSEMDQPKLF